MIVIKPQPTTQIYHNDFKVILGFLMGVCISLVTLFVYKNYSILISTLVGGGLGAILLGSISFLSTIKINLEETTINLVPWLYFQQIEPKLRKTYLFLIGLLLFCFFLALMIHSTNNLVKDFSINMASEILGILLVLLAVDRVIESEKDKKDKKKEKVAMQQIKQPILHHFNVLFETFQKVKDEADNANIQEISEIFDRLNNSETSQLSESLKSIDKLLYSIDDMDWLDYLSQESHSTKEALNRIVEKYSLFLEPSLLKSIEEFINSPFTLLITDYHEKFKSSDDSEQILQNQEQLFENPEFIYLLKQHLVKYFKLIKLFNKNTGEEEKNILLN